MTVETATYINQLNSSNPTGTADRSEADNHLRLIKAAVKATFPNITGAMTASQAELNLNVGNTHTLKDTFQRFSLSISAVVTDVARISQTVSVAVADLARISQTVSVVIADVARISQTVSVAVAKIASYSLSISSINTNITNLNSSVSSLNTAVANLSLSVSAIKSSISAMQTAISLSFSVVTADIARLSMSVSALNTEIASAQSWQLMNSVSLTATTQFIFLLYPETYYKWEIVIERPLTSIQRNIRLQAGYASGTTFTGYAAVLSPTSDVYPTKICVVRAEFCGIPLAATAGFLFGTAERMGSTSATTTSFKIGDITPRSLDSIRISLDAGAFEGTGTLRLYGRKR